MTDGLGGCVGRASRPATPDCALRVGLAEQQAYMQGCEACGVAVGVVWKASEMCPAQQLQAGACARVRVFH